MSKKIYNKLVRDKIPDVIRADGGKSKTRVLKDNDYLDELIKKLGEEYEEFKASPNIEELADIKEVLIALRQAMGIHAGELEEARRVKAKAKGRFKEHIFLESVEEA